MDYKIIDGDVTSPMGFTAVGVCCPIKEGNTEKKDLAFIYTFIISKILGGGGNMLVGDLIELEFVGGAYNPNLGAAISIILMIISFCRWKPSSSSWERTTR